MKYIFLFFPPGAAGHFFSRCLNLLDNSYCWVDTKTQLPVQNQQDKLALLSYQTISSADPTQRSWVQFENLVSRCQHQSLPITAQYVVWPSHPTYTLLQKNLIGIDDEQFVFLIDASDNFEWCILNALYKNSFISESWLRTAEGMRRDSNIQKINLQRIVNDCNGFLQEFQLVCDTIGHALTDSEKLAIITLYNEWKLTILDYIKFEEFKNSIGFNW